MGPLMLGNRSCHRASKLEVAYVMGLLKVQASGWE